MESNLSWATLFLLAILCAGLIVYAFWSWTKRGSRSIRRGVLIGLALLVAALPAGLRFWLTAADESDLLAQKDQAALEAFIAKQGAWTGDPAPTGSTPANQRDMSLEAVTAGLEKKLQANPDNVEGWILLGRSYTALKDRDRAAAIFRQTMAKWPDNIAAKVAYAEGLMAEVDGKVTDGARNTFEDVLKIDPSNIRARFNLARADFQDGKAQQAQDAWLKLANELPANSPWRPEIQSSLNESSAKLGVPAPKVATTAPPTSTSDRGPTRADVEAAQSMNPMERAAFIDSMVESLRARLEANPNDRDGWLRLAKSYGVLGRWTDAEAAYENGLKYFPGDPELAAGLTIAQGKS